MNRKQRMGVSEVVGGAILLLIISLSLLTITTSIIKIENTIDKSSKTASLRLIESTSPPSLIAVESNNATILKLEGGFISGIKQIILVSNGTYKIYNIEGNNRTIVLNMSNCLFEKIIVITELGNALYYDNPCTLNKNTYSSQIDPSIVNNGIIIQNRKSILNPKVKYNAIVVNRNITMEATTSIIDLGDRIKLEYRLNSSITTIVEYKSSSQFNFVKGEKIQLLLDNITIDIIPFIILNNGIIYVGYATLNNNMYYPIISEGNVKDIKIEYTIYKNGIVPIESIYVGPYIVSNLVTGKINLTKEIVSIDNSAGAVINGYVNATYVGHYIIIERIDLNKNIIYSSTVNKYRININKFIISYINVNVNVNVSSITYISYKLNEYTFINNKCWYADSLENIINTMLNVPYDHNVSITLSYLNRTYTRAIGVQEKIFTIGSYQNVSISLNVSSYSLTPLISVMNTTVKESNNIIVYDTSFVIYPCKIRYYSVEINTDFTSMIMPYTIEINSYNNIEYLFVRNIMVEELGALGEYVNNATLIVAYDIGNDLISITGGSILDQIGSISEPGFYMLFSIINREGYSVIPQFLIVN